MASLPPRAVALLVSTILSITAAAAYLVWHFSRESAPLSFHEVDSEHALSISQRVMLRAAAETPPGHLLRAKLTSEEVSKVMPLRPGKQRRVYDPFCYFRYKKNLSDWIEWPGHPVGRYALRTNSLGLRQDTELATTRPDLRVLVTGDSHMTGVCGNAECFAAVLEQRLAAERSERSVEVINGAHGAYTYYHYLGVLERFLSLGFDPDVFVVVTYGGNDFLGVFLWHFFHGTAQPKVSREQKIQRRDAQTEYAAAMGQILNSAEYFRRGGDQEVELALRMGLEATLEIQLLCDANGIELLVVYLPAPSELPDHTAIEAIEAGAAILQLDAADLARVGEMGDRLLADLTAEGISTLDLRPPFRGLEGELYWERDLHLNIAGHQATSDVVAPWIEAWWDGRDTAEDE